MDPAAAIRLARHLVAVHGLDGWQVGLDRAKSRAGCCHFASKLITFSLPLTRLHTEEEVRETILHEIAHALVGPEHGHDEVWRRRAVAIGSTGARCVPDAAPRLDGHVVGTCPAGHTVTRHRRPSRAASCPHCSTGFDPRFLFTWTWHGASVRMLPSYVADLVRVAGTTDATPVSEQLELDTVLGGGPGQPAVRALLAEPFRVGSRVTLSTEAGRYAGLRGVVVARGRTRYKVRCSGLQLQVPAALLRADEED